MQNLTAVIMMAPAAVIAAVASTVLLSYGVMMVIWMHAPILYVAVIVLPALAIVLVPSWRLA